MSNVPRLRYEDNEMAKSRETPKKIKLPRRIAGIRMPMAVRNGLVIGFLNSTAGRALVSEALVLAAGVFGPERLRSYATSRRGQEARVTVKEARARLSYACLEAMKAFRAALAESDRVIEGAAAEPIAEPKKIAAPRRRTRRRANRIA
jgi:hypothetical protein